MIYCSTLRKILKVFENLEFHKIYLLLSKDVPAFALVIGNPGKITGWVSKIGERLVFNDRDIAVCNKNGEKYQLINNHVKLVR